MLSIKISKNQKNQWSKSQKRKKLFAYSMMKLKKNK